MKLLMLMMFFMAFHRFIVLVAVHHGSWSLDPSLDPHVPLVQQSNLSKFLYLFRNHAQLCSAFFGACTVELSDVDIKRNAAVQPAPFFPYATVIKEMVRYIGPLRTRPYGAFQNAPGKMVHHYGG